MPLPPKSHFLSNRGFLICSAIVFSIASSTPSYALHASGGGEDILLTDNDTVRLAVQGSVGTLKGQAREVVFDAGTKLSELTWDLAGLSVGGASASLNVMNWFSFNIGYWSVLNNGSGSVDDYDWLLESPAWSDWSHSKANVKTGTVFDLNISRDLLRFKNWALDARLGRKKDNWKRSC